MYTNGSAENSMQMNYYMPITERKNVQHINACASTSSDALPKPRHATRILGRRYGLTSTWYKYLEIGINVGFVSTVDIVLGDNRGNQLLLPTETWKEMLKKRTEIDQLLQMAETSTFCIRDLSISIGTLHGDKIIKLTLSGNTLFFKRQTLDTLFNLEDCINHMYSWLGENTYLVNEKFTNFVKILQQKYKAEYSSSKSVNWQSATQAIRESGVFNCDSLIDCELLACALPNIVYDALNK